MDLIYLALEAPREGSAGYVHVHEIIKGLKKRLWHVKLYQPSYALKPHSPPLWQRLFIMLWVQLRLWVGWRRGATLYIRSHFMAFPTCLIAKLFGIPVIHEINGSYEDVFVTHPGLNRVKPVLTWMQKWQYRHASGLIAVTKELEQWAAIQSGGRPTAFISNGANTDLFTSDYERPTDLPANYVVFFGGLARWHGVPAMLEAVQSPSWPEDLALVVIGDGPESALVEDAARKDSRLIALGRKAYKELPPYVASALGGLVPISDPDKRSSTGVFPLKLFETLACGVPVIVTDLPGQADFVRDNECGMVVAIDDSEALAKAVKALYDKPEQATDMGCKGQKVVVSKHSWDAQSSRTEAFILAIQSSVSR